MPTNRHQPGAQTAASRERAAVSIPRPAEWIRLGIGLGAAGFFAVAILSHLLLPHSPAALEQRARELTAAALCAVALSIERRSRWAASLIALSAIWLEPTLAMTWRGTLAADSLLIYPPLILVSGLLLGPSAPLWGAAATAVAVLGGVGLHRLDAGQPFIPVAELHWFLVSAIVNFATALLTRSGLVAYRRAIEGSERARQRYAQLFDTAPDGLVELDRDGSITEANAAASELLGGERGALAGRAFTDVLVDAGAGGGCDIAGARRGAPLQVELAGERGRTLELSVQTVADPQSGRALLVVRDVTERRQMEQRLGQAQRLEMVGRLAGGVAHEINNPLTFVKTNLDMLVDEVLGKRRLSDGSLREMIDEMQTGVERIRRIVLDLQSFASEDEVGAAQACEVRAVVEESLRLAGVRLKRQIPIDVSLPSRCPDVHTTPRKLCQALVSLFINAGDALKGRQDPRVRLLASEEPGGLRFSVEDNGPGFSDETLRMAAEQFATSSGPGRGAGLGLALSREFVKRAGGTIRAENRAEGGTRISFCLRLA